MKKITFKFPSFILSLVLFLLSFNSFASAADTINNPKKPLSLKNSIAPNTIIPSVNSFIYKQDSESEFTDAYIKKNYPVSQDINKNLELALSTFETIAKNGNLTDVLEPKKLSMLPLGISKTVGGIQYILGISNAKFTPTYTELTAFVKIVLPQIDSLGNRKQLFFGANNIKLSHKGGLVGPTNLVLLGDVPLNILGQKTLLVLKGGMDMATGEVKNKTYVTIDCNGFKELGIEADVLFSRTMLEPVDASYNVIGGNSRVTASFKAVIGNWNDLLVDINLPTFQLTKHPGYCFELNNAVIDMSDTRNSSNVVWPKDYEKDYLVPGNEKLWRGFYVQSLKLVLPSQFKKKGTNDRITFQATNLLIDRMGVSGTFTGDNILNIGQGSASGWQFSVDHIELGFRANSLVSAGFNGGIVLPVSSGQCAEGGRGELGYKAIFNTIDNEYLLKAEIKNDICFQAFKGNATLEKNSYVELKVKEGKFLPKAVLYGTLSLSASNKPVTAADAVAGEKYVTVYDDKGNVIVPTKKETIAFKGIIFQNLTLQTVVPYITADYFGYKNNPEKDATVSNFPVTINEIALTADTESASLKVDLAINLMENQFNGQTKFYVIGKFAPEEGIQKWKFERLKFEEIKLAADLGGVKFKGSITILDNDPIYGNGFKGMLGADFTGGISVEANAIFGSTSFRYWYVDAMVDNLNIPAGAITFKGFGGGAYYKMKKDGFSNSFVASGSNYVPDVDSGLGVKAMLKFAGTATADAFWGGAGFEIAFNTHGGINRISIYGEGHVMQTFEIPGASELTDALKAVTENESLMSKVALEALKTSNLSKAAEDLYPTDVKQRMGINAFAAIEYDFRSKTLHGTFDLYIDTPGGFIKGRASGNRAGWAVLHFAPDKWYIRMGTPTDRLGIKLAIGSFEVEAGGYFMIGDDIPGSPPPPDIVAQILGVSAESLNYMRDENKVASGKGFAFGSDFSLKTGDLTFLIFYANFQCGFGFDIMVKDYGEAQCKGSGQIGLNGWYANGQSYAYLQGELGIKIKLFMIKKKISIIKGGGAVLLQAKLPNPVWIRGYLGGYFSLLGGAVKGSFRFKLEFGKQCEFVNDAPLGGLKTIADITPAEGAKDVSVFAVPQVGFNLPIEKSFTLEEDSGVKTYKLKLEEYTIKKDGVVIPGDITWNQTKDLLSFTPFEVLPQNSNLTSTVKISFQEYVNGTWKTIYDNGQIATETEVRNFTSGLAPNYIPVTNIAYCYPVIDQKYVYQNESKQAYVVLKQGQTYLFELKEGQSQKAFYKTSTNSNSTAITYNTSLKKVSIDLPVLQTSKPYNISLMTLETKNDANTNLKEGYTKQTLDQETSVDVKDNKLGEVITGGQGVELLQYNFNTSQYNSFSEKMAAKKPKQTLVEIIYSDVHALQSLNSSTEPFDEIEIIGSAKTLNIPLINAEAILDDSYYKNEIFPLVYNGYPLEADLQFDRNTAILGVPPTKGVETLAWYQDYIINNPTSYMLKEYLPYRYNLPYYYKTDFVNLRYKVVNKYLNTLNQQMVNKYDYIINGRFPYIKQGQYNIKLNYTLPGGQLGSSSIFTFNKSI
ncbi:hypothetical protein C8C83_5538 [Flavobacterium sp. 90]|uniref:hypothetical protein n=1 Tax=unclassified Flavobacterium TaxID=196869 RepID=UPI000EB44A93|nr:MULTISPECIES: hypothetical protein [unclassified Flavobacterium]RKR08300.1 hypothetical protein C8C82_0168 [Flavobacterium sp. 81]TCK57488.1 hypothetical protein C8C83_5538 [Flavobacterium sp. 90]